MIMMMNQTPWDEITKPNIDYNVRLVAESDKIPLYWGKDTAGNCIFVLELEGNHVEQYSKEMTLILGIKLDLQGVASQPTQRLILTLESYSNKDLFLGLCETLIASLNPVTDSATALSVTLTHIKRWKAFMASPRARLLSRDEQQGLFAELSFLLYLHNSSLRGQAAVEAWRGPDGSHQDFIWGNMAVEIKSLSGRERSTIWISSEDQLETVLDNLYLVVYKLSDSSTSDHAMSLNELVRYIEVELADPDAILELQKRLATYGYVEMKEYDKPKFLASTPTTYQVTDSFPKLVRSKLPEGVVRIGYGIELEKIREFECSIERLLDS